MIGYLIGECFRRSSSSLALRNYLHPLPPVSRRATSEARIILGPRATPPQIALFLSQNGLNKPIWTQFFILVGHVFTFNLATRTS